MRVFNLTDQPLMYGGRTIPPYGSEEVSLDFIPNRDLALQKAGVLSFGSLPRGWAKPSPKPEPTVSSLPVVVVDTPKTEAVEPPVTEKLDLAVLEKLDSSFKKKK